MKQYNFEFGSEEALRAELDRISQKTKNMVYSCFVIHLFTEMTEHDRIEYMLGIIRDKLPDAVILGCSSNGNIVNGNLSRSDFAMTCSIFEYPDTMMETLQYSYDKLETAELYEALTEEISKRPWVKCIELLDTMHGRSMTALCRHLSDLPEDIMVMGGGAFSGDINGEEACVFSNQGFLNNGIVFLLMGGDDLQVQTSYVTGWRPLGSYHKVTSSNGRILKELDNEPAYSTYYRYLHINNDENFFHNTLEFPLIFNLNGIEIMRAPTASNPDGSLTMTSDISENVDVRIAFGDPATILESVERASETLIPFAPETIQIFSCAGRRTFWGNDDIGKETESYQAIAPAYGFYTSGEFLRTGKHVNQHNVTQVIAAIREGKLHDAVPAPNMRSDENSDSKVPMVMRMATFINAITDELEEANRKLSEMAVRDSMTGVWNKNAYYDRIKELEDNWGNQSFCVAVFDMNRLKMINDHYGHEVGDEAIRQGVNVLKRVFGTNDLYRTGGDEFIVVLSGIDHDEMKQRFDLLDKELASLNKKRSADMLSVGFSKGLAVFDPETDREYMEVFRRADHEMYRDKERFYSNKANDRRSRV